MLKTFATLAALACAMPLSATQPVVGIVEFENLAGSLPWWHGGMGRDLAALLSDELAATGEFSVMNRLDVSDALEGEANGEAGLENDSRYLVRAAVSYYRERGGSRTSRFRIRGVDIRGRARGAEIAVDYEIIDLASGRPVHGDTIDTRSGGLDLNVGYYEPQLSGELGRYRDQPAGKAIGKVIGKLTREIECVLAEGGGCGP
jgi:curli biogenesis system outer membrane secretion channel CsgG